MTLLTNNEQRLINDRFSETRNRFCGLLFSIFTVYFELYTNLAQAPDKQTHTHEKA